MSEQIIINIVRPEVGIMYQSESKEALAADHLAAAELGIHALAQHICKLRESLGLECPALIKDIIQSDIWQNGF